VYRVPVIPVWRSARPPGAAIGEMNPVQEMSGRPKPHRKTVVEIGIGCAADCLDIQFYA
jgi:hypothetical protein